MARDSEYNLVGTPALALSAEKHEENSQLKPPVLARMN